MDRIVKTTRPTLTWALLLLLGTPGLGQNNIPFTSGPIPLCDTSVFTANVSGVGPLGFPGEPWSWWIASLTINITSDHPQTLSISLTSPEGTTLLLSAFNGAGGQNYTNTTFAEWGWNPITSGTAPFTGDWVPQGGSLNSFTGENANGTWTITVVDTACANGGVGPGGSWTPGWFDGSTGTGGFAFGFSGPPPCMGGIMPGAENICAGGTVDILGFYTAQNTWYTYSIGQFGIAVPDPTAVSVPGTYDVEAFDPMEGCMYWAQFQVIVDPTVDLGVDQSTSYCGGNPPLDLTALFDLAGATPAWSVDGNVITALEAASVTEPGTYQLVGSTPAGCNDTALVVVDQALGVILGPDQTVDLCAGGLLDLTTLYDLGNASGSWSLGGQPVADPSSASAAGVYTLTGSTPFGCSDMAEVTVSVVPAITIGADQTATFCTNTTMDLTALFNTDGLTSAWSTQQIPVTQPWAIQAGGVYQLIVTNAAGCTDTALVDVTANASTPLGADVLLTTCEGEAEDATGMYDTSGQTSTWSLAGTVVDTPWALTDPGIYTLVATNAVGCSDTALVELEVVPMPQPGPDQIWNGCDGTVLDLGTLFTIGANTATWTMNGSAVPATVEESGTYMLTLTNGGGCTASAMATVSFSPTPTLGPDLGEVICAGAALDLTALFTTGALTTAWTMNGQNVTDANAADQAGSYRLVVTNAWACTDTAWVALAVNPLPDLGPDQTFTICPWQEVDLSNSFPVNGLNATYLIDGTAVVDPTAVDTAGTFTIQVSDAAGCTDESLATIAEVECQCVADFTENGRCMQDPVQFALIADSTVLGARWEFAGAANPSSALAPSVSFAAAGEVQVSVEATLTCGVVRVERTIRLVDCSDSCTVWIPNAFSPDGDLINDAWSWQGECRPADYEMRVFDRWGAEIFATTDPEESWDGTASGKPAPPGIYNYLAGYSLPYQDRHAVKGSVTLLR